MTFAEQEFRERRRANPLKAPAAPVREAEPAQAGDPRALTADEMDDAARYFGGFGLGKVNFVADRAQITRWRRLGLAHRRRGRFQRVGAAALPKLLLCEFHFSTYSVQLSPRSRGNFFSGWFSP